MSGLSLLTLIASLSSQDVPSGPYLDWSAFKPGAWAVRRSMELRGKPPKWEIASESFERLVELSDDAVVVLRVDRFLGEGAGRPREFCWAYPAKGPAVPKEKADRDGSETLTVGGKSVKCTWTEIKGKTKTWRSAQMPGGMVRLQSGEHRTEVVQWGIEPNPKIEMENPEYVRWASAKPGSWKTTTSKAVLNPPVAGLMETEETQKLLKVGEATLTLEIKRDQEKPFEHLVPKVTWRMEEGGKATEGAETLDIAGRKLSCKWHRVDWDETHKETTWTCPDVPGQVVKREILLPYRRSVSGRQEKDGQSTTTWTVRDWKGD